MTTLTQKTTRVTEAQGNFIDQFRAHANIDALIEALAQQSQEVEDAAFEILTETDIATAVGLQLDGLGEIVGVERGGRSDADYRVRIGAQILLNNSSGTIPEMIAIAVALSSATISVLEVFPAKLEIETAPEIINGTEVANVLAEARPAGVGLTFTWYESTNPFLFDTVGQGFDEGELGERIHF